MQQKHTKLAVPWRVKTYHFDVDYSSRPCYWFLQLILVHVLLKRSKTAADSLLLLQCWAACLHELFLHGYSPEGCCSFYGSVFTSSDY